MTKKQDNQQANGSAQYIERHRRGVLSALASFYQDRPHQHRTRKAGKGVIAR
jgi:hypothetical protein